MATRPSPSGSPERLGSCILRESESRPAFDMRVWLVRSWAGELANAAPTEHDRIAWFEASELAGLRLADDSYVSLITTVLADQGSRR